MLVGTLVFDGLRLDRKFGKLWFLVSVADR